MRDSRVDIVWRRRGDYQTANLASGVDCGRAGRGERVGHSRRCRLDVNPEDAPQALALADSQGFGDAPILAGHMLIAAEAHLYAPHREIFFPGQGDDLIRFDDQLLKAYSLSAAERQQLDGPAIDRLQLADHRIADPTRTLNSVRQIVALDIGGGADVANSERLLRALGFRKVAAPTLRPPPRVIFDSLWTTVALWSRP